MQPRIELKLTAQAAVPCLARVMIRVQLGIAAVNANLNLNQTTTKSFLLVSVFGKVLKKKIGLSFRVLFVTDQLVSGLLGDATYYCFQRPFLIQQSGH